MIRYKIDKITSNTHFQKLRKVVSKYSSREQQKIVQLRRSINDYLDKEREKIRLETRDKFQKELEKKIVKIRNDLSLEIRIKIENEYKEKFNINKVPVPLGRTTINGLNLALRDNHPIIDQHLRNIQQPHLLQHSETISSEETTDFYNTAEESSDNDISVDNDDIVNYDDVTQVSTVDNVLIEENNGNTAIYKRIDDDDKDNMNSDDDNEHNVVAICQDDRGTMNKVFDYMTGVQLVDYYCGNCKELIAQIDKSSTIKYKKCAKCNFFNKLQYENKKSK